MLINQYKSRRQWHLLPSDTKAPVVIVWWKITESKRAEELKNAKVFVEIFVEEQHRKLAEQEKAFTASLKGYGVVSSRKETTIEKLNKKI